MRSNPEETSEAVYESLIRLLHQDAPAENMVAQLARAEDLPIAAHKKSALMDCIRMAMTIRNRLELQQKREHGLLAVIESAQDLSSHLDLMELLHAIVTRARNLLGSHVAWITMYNAAADELQVQVADGAIFKDTDKMTTRKQLGVGGVIFTTGRPFSTSDYLSDNRFEHDPVLDTIFENEGISSLVGVPLMSENEVIGLLFVADRYHRSHTALEVSILSTLATHAAVAFKTAMAFDLTNTALKNADSAREELESHVKVIHSAAEAHNQLTSLLAQGASVSTLCDAVAQLLGGCVMVVDEARQLICRGESPNYVDLSSPYHPYGDNSQFIESAIRESRLSGRSVIAYQGNDGVCRVVSVFAGEDVVGAILLFREEDLGEVAIRTFERSSSVIGIGLLAQERLEIHRTRDTAALLRGLLLPHEYEWSLTVERAQRCQLDLSQSYTLLLVEPDQVKAAYVAKRLRAMSAFSHVVLDDIDGVVAVICNVDIAQDIVQACSKFFMTEIKTPFWGVESRPSMTAEDLSAMYTTLRRTLMVAKRLSVNGIHHQNELALYSVLFESLDMTSLNGFLDSTIGGLLAYDQKRNAKLTATLLCHFDCNRNANLVAKRMNIHVNTVRQRLERIEDMIGRFDSSSRALEIHMALRLWELRRK